MVATSNISWNFHPDPLGEDDSQFDGSHIFQMGGEKPPTRKAVKSWTVFGCDRWMFFIAASNGGGSVGKNAFISRFKNLDVS